jgi:hypothetical protein
MVVGVCAFSSSWRGWRLIPAKWRYLVPPASPHQGASATGNAHRPAFVARIETAIRNAYMEQAKTHSSLDKESMIEWANQELGREIKYEEIKNTDTSIVLEGIYEGDSVYLKSANQAANFESH